MIQYTHVRGVLHARTDARAACAGARRVWREYLGDARLHGGVVCHVGRHVVDFLLAGAHQCAAGATVGAAVVVGIPAGMPTRGGGLTWSAEVQSLEISATASSSLDFVRATIVTWLPRLANSLARASPMLPGRADTHEPLRVWCERARARAGAAEGAATALGVRRVPGGAA